MGLIVEDVFRELEQIGLLLGLVELAQLPVVHLDFLRIVEIAVVRAGHRMRQVFADIGERIDDVLAIAFDVTSKLPLRSASNHGPVGNTCWVTCRPILLHWSTTQIP